MLSTRHPHTARHHQQVSGFRYHQRLVAESVPFGVVRRRLAVDVTVGVLRNQPLAVAHDTLNPLGRLRLRVFLKWRADSLGENDERE